MKSTYSVWNSSLRNMFSFSPMTLTLPTLLVSTSSLTGPRQSTNQSLALKIPSPQMNSMPTQDCKPLLKSTGLQLALSHRLKTRANAAHVGLSPQPAPSKVPTRLNQVSCCLSPNSNLFLVSKPAWAAEVDGNHALLCTTKPITLSLRQLTLTLQVLASMAPAFTMQQKQQASFPLAGQVLLQTQSPT